ncbi:MAG: DUF2273 domain-containing protein [Peptococcaceae bacterium]|nr:DUF2273 domain-containing protein [Peptococcaceae bacterium]
MREIWRLFTERFTQILLQLLDEHPGKVLGVLLGFGIGFVIVVLGFWRTLVIVLCALIGLYLGKRRDEHRDFSEVLKTFFGERR